MQPGQSTLKTLTISFISDTARINKELDDLIMKLNRIHKMTGGLGGIKVGGVTAGPQKTGAGVVSAASITNMEKMDKSVEKLVGTNGAGGSLGSFGNFLGKIFPPKVALAVTAMEAAMSMFQRLGRFILKIASMPFHYGNIAERGLTMMEVATGSVKQAHAMMKEAIRYSTLTPFSPSEVVAGASLATQYGIDAFERGKYKLPKNRHAMDIIGGLASYQTPQGPIGMSRAILAVTRGDRRYIRPFGFPVQRAYDQALASGNRTGTPGFVNKFLEALGKIPQVMEMARKHSETIVGLWSTIAGLADEAWIAFSGAMEEKGVLTFWSQIRDTLLEIREWGLGLIDELKPGFRELGTFVGSIFRFIYDIVTNVGKILAPVFMPILTVMVEVGRVLMMTFTFVFQTIGKVLGVVSRIVESITGWKDIIKEIMDGFSEFITGLAVTFQLATLFIDRTIEMFMRFIDRFEKRVGKMGEILSGVLGPLLPGIKAMEAIQKKFPESESKGKAYEPGFDPFGLKSGTMFFHKMDQELLDQEKREKGQKKTIQDKQGSTGNTYNNSYSVTGLGPQEAEMLDFSGWAMNLPFVAKEGR